MTAAVSAIITCHNYGKYVAESVESVLAQTMTDFELLIVEDGSTDNSARVIERYRSHPRVRIVPTGGLGQSRAKNLGCRLATAPYLALLDADDSWLPTKLERQLSLAQAQPEVAVIGTLRHLIDEHGQPLPPRPAHMHRGWVHKPMFLQNFLCYSSTLVKRQALEHVGCLDRQMVLAADYELWLRLSRQYEFDYVNEPLVNYRYGHASVGRRRLDRLDVVFLAMQRAVENRGSLAHFNQAHADLCWADSYLHLASLSVDSSPLQCLRDSARALRRDPWRWSHWKQASLYFAKSVAKRCFRSKRQGCT